jgi:hypothetical protein
LETSHRVLTLRIFFTANACGVANIFLLFNNILLEWIHRQSRQTIGLGLTKISSVLAAMWMMCITAFF